MLFQQCADRRTPTTMRTTINLEDDALNAARYLAQRERMSLGQAVSMLIRRGSNAGAVPAAGRSRVKLRGRFALLPERGELITTQQVRELMEREGI